MNTFLNICSESSIGSNLRARLIANNSGRTIDQKISERGMYEQWHTRMCSNRIEGRRAARISNQGQRIIV